MENALLPAHRKRQGAAASADMRSLSRGQTLPPGLQEHIGRTVNSWTIVKYVGARSRPGGGWTYLFHVQCTCGSERTRELGHIVSGNSTSCGCRRSKQLAARNKTHGKSGTREHQIWKAMHKRCNNQNDLAYTRYGGRGISVCLRWSGLSGFANFLSDMGLAFSEATIERSDNEGNYEPKNCRWASHKQQNRNKRSNLNVTHRGRTQCLAAWAEEKGLAQGCLYYRIVTAKWDTARALETPSASAKSV